MHVRSQFAVAATALVVVAVGLASVAPDASAGVEQARSGAKAGATYVALGDSYSAGEGLGRFQAGTSVSKGAKRNTCHRSSKDAYSDLSPAVVLPQVTSRAFWACSGAHASEMLTGTLASGDTAQYGQPVQVDTVNASTKYISISAGGNDAGFGALGLACAKIVVARKLPISLGGSCSSQLKSSTKSLAGLRVTLAKLYATLHKRSPDAVIVVMGYPRVFPATYSGTPKLLGSRYCVLDNYLGAAVVGMPVSDAQKLDTFSVALNATIQNAISDATSVDPGLQPLLRYADTYTPAVPHNCKGTTPHATVTAAELSLGKGISGSSLGSKLEKLWVSSGTFHPTKEGQKLFAKVIQTAFTTTPAPPACAGVSLCHVVDHVDLDGDGRAEEIAVEGAPSGSPPLSFYNSGDTVTLRVYTGRGALITYPVSLNGWYGAVYNGAANVTGGAGNEIIVGYTAGAHYTSFTMLALQGGALEVVRSPMDDFPGTGYGDWGVDGSVTSNLSTTCLGGGVIDQASASGAFDDSDGSVSYDTYEQQFRWDGAQWQELDDGSYASDQSFDEGVPAKYSGWHCGTFTSYRPDPAASS